MTNRKPSAKFILNKNWEQIMKPTLQEPLYQQGLIVDLLGYFSNRYNHNATFEVFVREMPKNRSYLFLLSMINFQTLIASKAARVVQAATLNGRQRGVMEFGSRRAHGPEASILAARASYIAGCVGSSNVMAGMRFGIPVYGTAAHSWTMAFGKELDAFRAYHKVFPQSTILLIDTYDIEQGARNAVKIGPALKGVRIDSGDLLQESRKVRKILDAADMQHV
ncbi:hypothetical protein B1H10_03585, partial [candidate division KSB1 bacterium 4484_188]